MVKGIRLVFLLFVAAVCVACGDDRNSDGSSANTDSQNPAEAACALLEPASLSGQPLDALALSDQELTAEERDNLWFEYQFEGEWYPGVIEGGLEPVMVVPIHPNGIDGGKLNIRFIDGLADSTCGGEAPSVLELTVTPLAPAPGELQRFTAAYVELLDAFLVAQDLSRDELLAGPVDQVPVHVMPALVGWGALADPDNPNSLEALSSANGPWASKEGFSRDVELMEALLAKAGVVESLETSATGIAEYERATALEFEPVTVTPVELTGGLTAASLLRVKIDNSAELSDWMKFALEGDAMRQASDTVNSIATYVGLVPAFSVGANIAGLMTAVLSELSNAIVELLPKTLNGINIEASPTTYLEDQERFGRITSYEIMAESGRWAFSQAFVNLIVEVLFFKWSSARNSGDELRQANKARTAANEAAEATLRDRARRAGRDRLADLGETEITNEVKNQIKNLFDALTTAEVGPFFWGPFDLAGTTAMYAEVEGTAVGLRTDIGEYESLEVGGATVTAVARATEFPPLSNEASSAISVNVEVLPIIVEVDPPARLVVPGEVLEVRGIVSNAEDDILAWSSTDARVEPSIDTRTATVTIPADAQEGDVIVVTATSNSNGGLRTGQFRKEEREGTATFFLRERVTVNPGYRCVAPGESVDFDATVVASPGNTELDWSATGGDLSVSTDTQSATYTAPAAEGFYEINARLVSNPDIADSGFVRVGSCRCFFDGFVAGLGGVGGPQAEAISVGPVESFLGDWPDEQSQEGFTATSGDNGQYALIVTLSSGDVYLTPDATATLVGRTTSDGFVEGTFEASVQSAMDTSESPTMYPASIRFRAIVNPEFGGACIGLDE